MKRRSSWSAMWCRAVISSWESAGWVSSYGKAPTTPTVTEALGEEPAKEPTSGHLALDERSEQDEDGDTGPDDEVDKVPEGQTAHFPQSHLFDLQAESVPLVPQRTLEANQDHLQSWDDTEDESLDRQEAVDDLGFLPRYAAWLVDSAKPSRRRSFPVSPGVEQWAGEASSMKFLVREVEMIRGGRRMLMTVWSSRKISGGSR